MLPGRLTVMDAWCGAGEPLLIVKRAQQPDLVTVQRGDIKMASDSSLPNAAPLANKAGSKLRLFGGRPGPTIDSSPQSGDLELRLGVTAGAWEGREAASSL